MRYNNDSNSSTNNHYSKNITMTMYKALRLRGYVGSFPLKGKEGGRCLGSIKDCGVLTINRRNREVKRENYREKQKFAIKMTKDQILNYNRKLWFDV